MQDCFHGNSERVGVVSWQGFNLCGAGLVRQHGDVELWRVIVV
jgi:hypothetical protein